MSDARGVVVVQLGARMHYAVPRALAEAGYLQALVTDICSATRGARAAAWALARGSPLLSKKIRDRDIAGIDVRRIKSNAVLGAAYWAKLRFARSERERSVAHLGVGSAIARRGAEVSRNAGAVYGFNTASLEMLCAARERGIPGVVEQTIAPAACERDIVRRERDLWPGWEAEGDEPLWQEFADRESSEWAAARVVVCGSSFVKDSLGAIGGPVDKCVVIPYGVKVHDLRVGERRKPRNNLRVLFAGTVGLRKGVQYLAEVSKLLGAGVEFRVAGPVRLTSFGVAQVRRFADVAGVVARSDMAREYAEADVFVLPTLCEGSATVCYEAMSAGLPVVTTAHAGSIIRHGYDGFVVPIRDPEAIAHTIEQLRRSAELRADIACNARRRAVQMSSDLYGANLVALFARLGLAPCA